MNRAFWSSSPVGEGRDWEALFRSWPFDVAEAVTWPPLVPAVVSDVLARPCRLMLSPAHNAAASKQTPAKNTAMTCRLLIVSRSFLSAMIWTHCLDEASLDRRRQTLKPPCRARQSTQRYLSESETPRSYCVPPRSRSEFADILVEWQLAQWR